MAFISQRDEDGQHLVNRKMVDIKSDDSLDYTRLMSMEPNMEMESAGPHLAHIAHTAVASATGIDDIVEDDDEIGLGDDGRSLLDTGVRQRPPVGLRDDLPSIMLLLFLYLLQGIPLGLIASIPLVLQSRRVTYAQQALFSLAYWPFSLKLLWAPIVDSTYSVRIGRRKTWLVPTQYLIGIFMLFLSTQMDYILSDDGRPINVVFITAVFLPLNFLAATQDIAVDGWALTMLSRNVGYASTCNAVGQTAGFFLGNVVFLSLESAEFCNFFRSTPLPYGFVTLAGFMGFWGWVFVIATTCVLVFKREIDHRASTTEIMGDHIGGILPAYRLCWKIIKLKPVISLVCIYLTAKIAFAATDGMTGLKLIEFGVPKDKLASFAIVLTPVQVLLPWVIGKYTAGPTPLNVNRKQRFSILMGGVFAFLIWWTPTLRAGPSEPFPIIFYLIWVFAYCLHQITTYSIFVAVMAFNAQISDPIVGGTYMTLLNTVTNLGSNWPVTTALSLVDDFTWKHCYPRNDTIVLLHSSACDSIEDEQSCVNSGGICHLIVDGYYILVAICSVVGIIWLLYVIPKLRYLQTIDKSQWSCSVFSSKFKR